jgi:hypothetical protein
MDFKKEDNDSDFKQYMYLLYSVYYRSKGVRHVKKQNFYFLKYNFLSFTMKVNKNLRRLLFNNITMRI